MVTVNLHFIETDPRDLFTHDTYAIEGSGFPVSSNSLMHESEAYELPPGYSLGKTVSDELAIFDDKNNHCHLDRFGHTPRLSSASGVVWLKKSVK